DPAPMNRQHPKFRVSTGRHVHPNAFLAGKSYSGESSLQRAAGQKLAPGFLDAQARWIEKLHQNHSWAAVEDPDQVENLTDGYTDVQYDLSQLPTSGEVSQKVWSDDYWKTQYGQTSYRYGEGKDFKNYEEAIGDYRQPETFTALLDKITPDHIKSELLQWSPAE